MTKVTGERQADVAISRSLWQRCCTGQLGGWQRPDDGTPTPRDDGRGEQTERRSKIRSVPQDGTEGVVLLN
jgi:hypothetical protein